MLALHVHLMFRNIPTQSSSRNWNEKEKLPPGSVSPPFLRLAKNQLKLVSKALSKHSLNRWWKCSDFFTLCPCTHLHINSKPFGAKGLMILAASPLPPAPIFTMRTSRTETELNTEDWGDLCWVVHDGAAQGRFILCDSSPWQYYRKSGSCWGANMYPLHWDVGRWWWNCFCHKALTNYQD